MYKNRQSGVCEGVNNTTIVIDKCSDKWNNLVGGLTFSFDLSIVMSTDNRVNVIAVHNKTTTSTKSLNFTNSSIALGGDTGQLVVTVEQTPIPTETVSIDPKLTYTKSDGVSSGVTSLNCTQSITVEPGNYEVEAGAQQSINIDPYAYYFQPDGNHYKITLNLQDIWSVDGVELSDYMKIYSICTDPATARTDSGNVVLRNAASDEENVTTAAKVVTKKMYGNLGANTTVFLIPYNKQNTDDYSYIGVPANIYNATTGTLETVLQEIADKIKSLARYSEVKNVQ